MSRVLARNASKRRSPACAGSVRRPHCPFSAAIAVRRVISELALPAVSAVALDHQVAPELLIGIQSHYTNGRARLYVIDRGNDLVPLASDFWPTID